jgi:hypothetical protein
MGSGSGGSGCEACRKEDRGEEALVTSAPRGCSPIPSLTATTPPRPVLSVLPSGPSSGSRPPGVCALPSPHGALAAGSLCTLCPANGTQQGPCKCMRTCLDTAQNPVWPLSVVSYLAQPGMDLKLISRAHLGADWLSKNGSSSRGGKGNRQRGLGCPGPGLYCPFFRTSAGYTNRSDTCRRGKATPG